MSLTPGTRLGPYEITAAIGAGGMGEVFRARDTKLNRDVAIKVLPAAFAGDPERLARFTREAQTLASLNHPNIATIYGIEEVPAERGSGSRALVMELVEGEDLAERLKRGAIPVDEAIALAKQIAEGLEDAHEHGIIHRDLKPANIKLTLEGKAKILDFGLAKALEGDQGHSQTNSQLSHSPTMSRHMTEAGMIMGTAAYMSPEQARGKTVDKRADIWSFGVVLFEMLTGTRLFAGETVSDTLASVLREEVAWDRLPKDTPPHVTLVLKRCLTRDPHDRLRDIGDARLALLGAFETASRSTTGMAGSPAPSAASKWLMAVASGAVIIAVVALVAWWRATRPVERPLVRLDVDLGADVSLGSLAGPDAVISPDGTRIVYVSHGQLRTRRLDEAKATELNGTQGAYAPFFSPDGHWVAFFTGTLLKKTSVEGGAVIVLCAAPGGRGGSWGEDGAIIAALGLRGGLSRVSAAGGQPTPLTPLQSGERAHHWPQILQGGKAVVFTAAVGAAANIEALSLLDHRRTTLVRGGSFGRYVQSGHLVYMNQGTLSGVPFDPDLLEVRGMPAPVLDKVGYSFVDGSAQLDLSQTGTFLYRGGGVGAYGLTMAWLSGAGKVLPLLTKPGPYGRPKVSPDGSRLALDNAGDVWTYDWQRDIMTRLTSDGGTGALWSPDNRFVLYSGASGIGYMRADGGTAPQTLIASRSVIYPWSFSPDGKRLAYLEITEMGHFDLYSASVENDATTLRAGTPEPFLKTPADERYPAFSPDGRWLVYTSNESGISQVYVRAFPDQGGKWQISNDGGTYPNWSSDRRTIFFRTLDNRIMTVDYTSKGDAFTSGKPRLWSNETIAEVGTSRNYDLHPDGKRVVALMPVETVGGQKAQHQVTFLLNFFDELRRKVPLGDR
jgi:Tol biopolymer transport system component